MELLKDKLKRKADLSRKEQSYVSNSANEKPISFWSKSKDLIKITYDLIVVILFTIVAIIVILTSARIVYLVFENDSSVIHSFTVTEKMEKEGLTGPFLSKCFLEDVNAFINDADTVKGITNYPKYLYSEFENPNNTSFKLNIGGFSIDGSLQSLAKEIKILFGKEDQDIYGSFYEDSGWMYLKLSVGKKSFYFSEYREILNDNQLAELLLEDAVINRITYFYPNTAANYFYKIKNYKESLYWSQQGEAKSKDEKKEKLFWEGISQIELGKYKEGIKTLQSSIEIDSIQPWVHYNIARAYAILKDTSNADREIDIALHYDSNEPIFIYQKAICQFNKKQYDNTQKYLRKGIGIKSHLGDYYDFMAIIFAYRHQYDSASVYFDKAYNFDPTYQRSSGRTSAHIMIGYPDDTIIPPLLFSNEIEVKYGNYKYAYNYFGYRWMNLSQWDSAQMCFSKAIAIDSNFQEAWINLADCAFGLQNYEEGNKILKTAYEINSQSASVLESWTKNFIFLNDFKSANQKCEQLLAMSSFDKYGLAVKGFILNNMGRPDEAQLHYRIYHKLIGNSTFFLNCWGDVLQDLQKPQEALEKYHLALEESPNDYGINISLAKLYYNQNRYRDATEYYKEIIKKFPGISEPYREAAKSELKLNHFTEAGCLIDSALKLDPTDFLTLAIKAQFEYNVKHNYTNSEQYADRAISLLRKNGFYSKRWELNTRFQGDYSIAFIHKAYCRFNKKDYEKAISYCKEALEYDPSNCDYLLFWKACINAQQKNPNFDLSFGNAMRRSNCNIPYN